MKKKKTVQYSAGKDRQPSMVNEPAVLYGSPLVLLAGLQPTEIAEMELSGESLAHIAEETGLQPQDMADLLGIGKSKYYDLLKLSQLDVRTIDALADFAQLWKLGLEAFDGDKAHLQAWLDRPNENLGGMPPLSLLGSRVGRRLLEKALLRIEYSLYG